MDTNAPDLTGKNPRHFKHLDTIKCLVRNKMTPITAKTSCGRIHQTSGKNLPRKIHIIKSKVILVLTRYPEKVPYIRWVLSHVNHYILPYTLL